MVRKILLMPALLLGAAACHQGEPENNPNFEVLVPKAGTPAPNVPPPPAPHPPAPALDPKSSEAAVQLVSRFADMLNRSQFAEAWMLLGPGAPPRAEFEREFAGYSDLAVTTGAAGAQEGAAGSIFLSVPLTVSGTIEGKRQSRSATAVVRRVNDVPGSTEAQRRWHIERIDWTR